jgi:hypothetical protein
LLRQYRHLDARLRKIRRQLDVCDRDQALNTRVIEAARDFGLDGATNLTRDLQRAIGALRLLTERTTQARGPRSGTLSSGFRSRFPYEFAIARKPRIRITPTRPLRWS